MKTLSGLEFEKPTMKSYRKGIKYQEDMRGQSHIDDESICPDDFSEFSIPGMSSTDRDGKKCDFKESKPFNETPMLSLIFRMCLGAIRPTWDCICAIRWCLCRSLNIAILPCCTMPNVYPLKYIPHVTLGEVRK